MKLSTSILSLATLSHALVLPRADCSNITCVASSSSSTASASAGAGAAHIIVTRASTEAEGPGILAAVADAVISACPGSDLAYNPYPALLDPYLASEAEGVGNLTELVTTYQACCPDSKMVLMGYSQGAQVTADFLCGTSETGFNATPAYAAEVADALDAIVLMGDPSFVKGLSWDRGNASNVSFFPRLDNAACTPIASKMISYCDSGDFYCDNGTASNALAIHEGYVSEYGSQAADWVVSQIGGCSS